MPTMMIDKTNAIKPMLNSLSHNHSPKKIGQDSTKRAPYILNAKVQLTRTQRFKYKFTKAACIYIYDPPGNGGIGLYSSNLLRRRVIQL